jgi:hypothetical protein
MLLEVQLSNQTQSGSIYRFIYSILFISRCVDMVGFAAHYIMKLL